MSRRIVDLSHPIREGMTVFPVEWHPHVEVTVMGTHERHGRETRRLLLGTHTGTHVDAPRHFVPGGATIDEVPLDALVGPARLVDLSGLPAGSAVGVAELEAALGEARPERLLLRHGWSSRYADEGFYVGHSYLTQEAARWLVARGVRLVGMDTPMPDSPEDGRGHDPDSPIHKILLGNGVVLVEYLRNLHELRGPDVELIVLPLNVVGGDGAPARCVAVETDPD